MHVLDKVLITERRVDFFANSMYETRAQKIFQDAYMLHLIKTQDLIS